MRYFAHASHLDANQTSIVIDLRRCGYAVQELNRQGGGCPDILISETRAPWRMWLCEIKVKEGRISESQQKWALDWRGKRPLLATSSAQILKELTRGDA